MAVPRNRYSNARKNSKRAHSAKVKKNFTPCKQCGTKILSHRLCPSCKTYSSAQPSKKNSPSSNE